MLPISRFSLASVLFVSLHANAAIGDTYPVKFNLGVVESWRAAPEAIGRWCEKLDPDGVEGRRAAHQAWIEQHNEVIREINSTFNTIVPIISPSRNPQINPVEAVRAHITTELLKIRFIGKSNDDAKAICKDYVPEQSSTAIERVKKALVELKKWQEENASPNK